MPYDADQIANMEALLDALEEPTTADVLAVADNYDAIIVAASAARRAINSGGGEGGGSSPLSVQHTQLTDAQIKALPSDGSNEPITVVDAPGEGLMVVPSLVVIVGPEVAYTGINAAAQLYVSNPAALVVVMWMEGASGMVTAILGVPDVRPVAAGGLSQDPITTPPAGVGSNTSAWADYNGVSGWDNQPLTIAAYNGDDGDFEDGDAENVMDVYVYYVTVPTT